MKKAETVINCLYDLSHSLAGSYLKELTYPWEALPHIKEWIEAIGAALPEEEYERRGETVWVHKTAKVFPSAYLGDHHRKRRRGPPLRVFKSQRPGGRGRRGGKFHRIKKCNFV